MRTIVIGLKDHYSHAEDTEKIIITAASVSAGASAVGGAVLTFCTVYLAGLIFLKTILSLAKKGKSGDALNHLSDLEFEKLLKDRRLTSPI